MCGRFTLKARDLDQLAEQLDIEVDDDARAAAMPLPRYNIAPMQEHYIVLPERETRVLRRSTWGLVNWWDASRREGAKHINARAESIDTVRPFRQAFEARRCLVPADGFYEWVGEKKQRRAFWFHQPEDEPFYFAGLYTDTRLRGEPEAISTFTIITTPPNALVTPIHDRMPAILPDEEAAAAWLYPEQDASTLRALLRPADDRFLVVRSVGSHVNAVANDDPDCIEEAEPETQSALL